LLLSQNEVLIEYPPLVDADQKSRPALGKAKISQAAINVKGIHVVFEGWGHEITRIEHRAKSMESRKSKKSTKLKA
jgi:hypothetical protein